MTRDVANETRPGLAGFRRRVPPAWAIMTGVLAFLAAGWTAVILVDVMNVGGSADALVEHPRLGVPFVFFHVFGEAGPVEFAQWGTLAALAVVCGVIGGALTRNGAVGPGAFWKLFAITATLMLIEDAGNVRHRLVWFVQMIGGGELGRVATIVELTYYGVLASVPGWAILRWGRHPLRVTATLWFGLAGVVAYAAAAGMSATRYVRDSYARMGDFIHERIFGGVLPLPHGWPEHHVPFYIMDHLVEETIELLGAALLLSAAVAYARRVTTDDLALETSWLFSRR